VAPKGAATRPTSDRVREALFSILGSLDGAAVLDLYAGTGALGIEALSRGAARVTFVEHARPALAALSKNLRSLALEAQAQVIPRPVERALEAPSWGEGAFDVVFADPPYAVIRDGHLAEVAALGRGALGRSVRQGGRLVLEHASADPPPALAGLRFAEMRRYGDTAISFYDPDAEARP
jgi:16S rRNA (guanine966-N2)-methyltransferase